MGRNKVFFWGLIFLLLVMPALAGAETDPVLLCIEKYQKEKGLSYEEAKRLCTAQVQTQAGTPATAQKLPDLVVKGIACGPGNKLLLTVANIGGPMPSGWTAVASVYFDGTGMGAVDLGRPTSGDITPSGGSASYLVAFDIARPVEVKVVVDAAYSITELDEGNNAMVAKVAPCEGVTAPVPPQDVTSECIARYQKEKGLSYEEAKRLCTAQAQTPAPVQYLPDLAVQEIYCGPGNKLNFNVANLLTPIPSGWAALADVYFDGVKMGSIDLGRPTGGDITVGGANYLTAFEIAKPVEVKIVVDVTNGVKEADEGNNAMVVKVAPCEGVTTPAPTEDPLAYCIRKYQQLKGLSYEEAKRLCIAEQAPPQVAGGCIEKYMDVFNITYEEAKKRCTEQVTTPKPVAVDRCGEIDKRLAILIEKLNAAQGEDAERLKKEIGALKTGLGACRVTPGVKNPCDEVKVLEESIRQLKEKMTYIEGLVVSGEMNKTDLEPYHRELESLDQRLEKMRFACQQGKPVEESPCVRLSKLEVVYREINDRLQAVQEEKSRAELKDKLASLAGEIAALKDRCRAEDLKTEKVESLYDIERAYREKQKVVVEGTPEGDLQTELAKIEGEKKKLLEDFAQRSADLDARQTTIIKKLEIKEGKVILDDIETNATKVKVEVEGKDIEIESSDGKTKIADGDTQAEGEVPLEYANGALKSSKSGREIKFTPSTLLRDIEGLDYVKIDDDVTWLPATLLFQPTELSPQPDPPGITIPRGTRVEKLEAGHFKFSLSDGKVVEVKNYDAKTRTAGDCAILDQNGAAIASGLKGILKGAPKPEKAAAAFVPSQLKELRLVDNGKPEYLAKVEKSGRLLGFIPTTVTREYRVSAESGAVTDVSAPWWSAITIIEPDPPS